MSLYEGVVLGSYFLVLSILAAFGLHRHVLVYLYYRHERRRARPVAPPRRLPRVTVQLPLYNEVYVVERLLGSVARLRYPKQLLEIQVLDDSTDETAAIAAAAVARYRGQGFEMRHIHREERKGYKAGALAEGLRAASGEFVLILDADFVAPPELLEKLLGHFEDPQVGMVQARWDHLNRDYSLLTEAQAMMLDAHFVLDHGGRNRSGRFFNFNGTAGIWRRRAIDDAGGWQHDTLTEDLDLSYRAQLRGWRFVFREDVVCSAEVPVEMNAFKSQQHRWAKGSVQTCRKLLPNLLASGLPPAVKLEAAFHLAANFAHPLMLVLSLLMLPSLALRHERGLRGLLILDLPLLLAGTLSVSSFYLAGQRELFAERWKERLKYLPLVMCVGVALSVTGTQAVLEAMLGRPSPFARTPKYRVESRADQWRWKCYRLDFSPVALMELLLAAYLGFGTYYALDSGLYGALPFTLLFAGGFLYAASLPLLQHWGGPVVARRREG